MLVGIESAGAYTVKVGVGNGEPKGSSAGVGVQSGVGVGGGRVGVSAAVTCAGRVDVGGKVGDDLAAALWVMVGCPTGVSATTGAPEPGVGVGGSIEGMDGGVFSPGSALVAPD